MRRYAYCMILLLTPAAAWAANTLSDAEASGCGYASSSGHGQLQDGTTPAHATPLPKPATPATTTGGGSDGDMLTPRMRMPKWHSFLPGMFR